jgi:hypothetical protein
MKNGIKSDDMQLNNSNEVYDYDNSYNDSLF